jgi:hypothetical protein
MQQVQKNGDMKPSPGKLVAALIAAVLGVIVFAFLVWLTFWASRDPSQVNRVFAVGIAATLVSPVGFALFQIAWKLRSPLSHEAVRNHDVVLQQLERAMSDWETADAERQAAEATKAQIDAYIAVALGPCCWKDSTNNGHWMQLG